MLGQVQLQGGVGNRGLLLSLSTAPNMASLWNTEV